mgnify:CR=1 FL=1
MNIREFTKEDLPEMIEIWNEIVEKGVAFPQKDGLTSENANEFFASQSFTAVAEENGEITISRASGAVTYPCNIMLVAAMNPCPCGNYGSTLRRCTCSMPQVAKYLSKISQPILDRIDIHAEVSAVSYDDLAGNGRTESSAAMAERIAKAREIQDKRFAGTAVRANSGITPDLLREVCVLDEKADAYLKLAFEKMGLSARAYDRVLKVARTCADLDGSELITKSHVARAISYRSLDRKYWGNSLSLS